MISFYEIIIIFIVALLAFGPEKLPDLVKNIGKLFRQFQSLKEGIKQQLDPPEQILPFKNNSDNKKAPNQNSLTDKDSPS